MSAKDVRQYVKIDVLLPTNTKLGGAPVSAKWLDVVGVCWAGQNRSNGEITPAIICATAGVPIKYAKELIERGRWHRKGHNCPDCEQPKTPGNLVIHHYLRHQTSAEKIERVSTARALSARKANHTKHKHEGDFEGCWICQG